MRRPALAVLLLMVLGGLGFLAWRWLDPPPPATTPGRRDAAAASQPADPASAPVSKLDAPVERTESPGVAPLATEPPPAPVAPASYRRALSGVRGRVVEEDGKPVPGLDVELLELLASSFLGDFERAFLPTPATVPDLSIARGRTDAEGVFQLDGALGHAFHALGVDLGGARGTVRFLDRTLTSGTTTDLGDIVLVPVVTWTGRIVDPDGVGVAGARVRATTFPPIVFQPGVIDVARIVALIEVRDWNSSVHVADVPAAVRAWDAKLPFPTALTDDEGAFRLAGVPQGLTTLIVDREGFTGAFKGPTPTGKRDRDVGTIELSRGRDVGGVVVDTDGRPIQGVEVIAGVRIEGAPIVIGMPASARTDANGAFVVEHLPDQGSSLRVAARRHATDAWVCETTDGSSAVRLVLPIGASVAVTSKDDSGAPVDGATYSLRTTGGPPFLTWQPPVAIDPSRVVPLEPGRVELRGVTPGEYELLGRAEGFGVAHAQLTVGSTSVATELRFHRARDLDVLVLDRDTREPIEYAELTVTAAGERMRPPLLTRRTDVAGRARLAPVPLEPLRLRAFHPAHAPSSLEIQVAELAAATSPVELVLGPGATLAGRVHQAGRPLAEPMLLLLMPERDGSSIDDETPRFAIPGPDGRFELRGLPAGEARWQLMPRLFGGDPQETVQKLAGARTDFATARSGNVLLKEGETVELDLDVDPAQAQRPARIVGVIRSNDGDKFRIRLHVSGEAIAPDQSGNVIDVAAGERFTIEPVAPGWVNLMVETTAAAGPGGKPMGGTLHHEWFEINAGEEHTFELDLELISGEALVLDASGAPVANAGVQFTLQKSETSRRSSMQSLTGMTGEDGIARTELPRPGRYEVRVADPQRGRAVAEIDFPSRKPVELRLDRGVVCSGRVEITPGLESDSHAWLSLESASSEGRGSEFGWVQLEGTKRDFAIVGVPPGRYRARLFTNRGGNATHDFELGPNGDDHLVLKFQLR